MRLWMLGSGSKGNAVLLETGAFRLLIDAGFQPRTLAERLRAVGVAPGSIGACVLTHEHGDHVRGAAAAAERWGWQLYASAGTADACPELPAARVTRFDAGAVVQIGGFSVATHASPHDAVQPVVLVATACATGARAGIAYDLGHVPHVLRAAFHDLDLLVIEANHDDAMLWTGPYPPSVRARIAGRTGHLSNRVAADFARGCVNRNLQHVVLAHLSEKCNDHGLAITSVRGALAGTHFHGQLHAAPQHGAVGPFLPGHARRAPESQLALAL